MIHSKIQYNFLSAIKEYLFMSKCLLVVAELDRARLFSIDKTSCIIEEMEYKVTSLSDPDLTEIEMAAPKRPAIIFAKAIAEYLEQAQIRNNYQAIILISTPPLEASLHECLGKKTRSCVTKSVPKELVPKAEKIISKYLF